LQWFGLLGAALAWTAQHVIGIGVTLARCGAGGRNWGLSLQAWELTLMSVTVVLILLSEAAAIRVLLATRELSETDPPPWGRRHFFALAASIGNVLFLVVVVLGTVGVVSQAACRQA
jgi:hypothetical protein